MPIRPPRIALDVAHLGFTENYRISAMRGVIQYARRHTEWQLLFNEKTLSLLHSFSRFSDLSRGGIDGVIFSYWDDAKLAEIESLHVPMVTISNDHPLPEARFACSVSDDHEVGCLAARDFLDRGFSHFAYYGDLAMYWEQERFSGFKKEIEAAGFTCDLIRNDYSESPEKVAADVSTRLDAIPRPIGVLASSDTRALHLLELCRSLGIQVPLEVAIIGVDNNELLCESQLPSLSSVAQDPLRVGYEAAALIDQMLKTGVQSLQQIRIPPKGVVTRMSSDIAAIDNPCLSVALLYIRDHAAESISVQQIAQEAGVSRSTLERLFQSRLRSTINDFLRRRRLAMAKDLLTQGVSSLQEVAERSGFRRSTYLCNVFQEELGITPGEWRRKFIPDSLREK